MHRVIFMCSQNINAQGDICVFPELVTKLVNCDGCLVCTDKPNSHYANNYHAQVLLLCTGFKIGIDVLKCLH